MPARLTSPAHVLQAMSGSPQHLGTIIATTTKNNHDTAVPFNNTGDALKGMTLLVQPSAACYVRPVDTNAGAATSGTAGTAGILLAANELYIFTMRSTDGWLACLSVSGTANLQVWQLV